MADFVTVVESQEPGEEGIYDGAVVTAAGQLGLTLYTAKYSDKTEFFLSADAYASLLEADTRAEA